MTLLDVESPIRCPSCAASVPGAARFCPSCGESVSSISQMATGLASPGVAPSSSAGRSSSPIGRLASTSDAAGFAPGVIVADRYRVIGLLGRGGMGEVYRADDLKLGQPVALKFLPRGLSEDAVRLERFYAEVRIARQVSHPNVCRVYDVAEVGGQHYLSMEYVDGEDLASLLKRIGRLPHDKAVEVARQICAGVAAAHDKGVLHRDLKPANVMIDGRGRARITDFGLAVAASDSTEGELSGTPAYMAPEQLAGRGASVQSDLYSLGLVLYELFTGRRAFEAANLSELKKVKSLPPIALTEVTRDIDAAVDRAILRCLEPDPHNRPVSALQLSAALPGGDPLAAALAAGETPSPEMVAASGHSDALRPSVAWSLLAAAILCLAVGIPLEERVRIDGLLSLEKPPAVLEDRAREILRSVGWPERPADSASGFDQDSDFLQYVLDHDQSRGRWANLETGPVSYWYRQSPRELSVRRFFGGTFHGGVVTTADPAPDVPGMALVRLNPAGKLTNLAVVPPQLEDAGAAAPARADWGPLFAAAGLDPAKWKPEPPIWTPRAFADERVAWSGALPQRPGVPMRIEAAAFRGKPVAFDLIGPWTRAARIAAPGGGAAARAGQAIFVLLFLALIVFGGLLARRNLRLGRGDRRGAIRVSIVAFLSLSAAWLVGGHHLASLNEFGVFLMFASWGLFVSFGLWALYIALEPFVRRRAPKTLVSWTRLLAGDFRDPVVGRDVLVGCAGAGVVFLIQALVVNVPRWLGRAPSYPDLVDSRTLSGTAAGIAQILANVSIAILIGFSFLLLLLALRTALRSTALGVTVFVLIFGGANVLQNSQSPGLAAAGIAVFLAATLTLLLRFGLLSAIVSYFLLVAVGMVPLTLRAAWYAPVGWMALAVYAVVAVAAFRFALGGKPAFGSLSPGD